MFSKVVVFGILAAVCSAIAPYGHEGHHEEEHHHAPAHYSFAYEVKDEHTGDIKSHHEERQGDHTKGVYSLIEPDGSKRTVEYTVEGKSGFNAIVHREHTKHPVHYGQHHAPQASYHHAAPQIAHHQVSYHQPIHQQASYHHQPIHHQASYHHQPVHHQVSYHHQPVHQQVAYHHQPVHQQATYHHQPVHHQVSYHHAAPQQSYQLAKPSYGHGGHATSSSHFSTHGAKVSTSTHHHVPQHHAPRHHY